MNDDADDNVQFDPPPVVSSMPLFAAYIAVYAIVGGVLLTASPGFERLYADSKMELPALTRGVMSFARWFHHVGWWVLLPIPIVMPAVVTRIAQQSGAAPRPRRHRRLFGVAGFVLLLAGVVILLAMILPYMAHPERIANPTGR